ncbi:hypothetical protein CROQUDRAFT_55050 [Cronartium quercuum f. sp. fusiforme G11]|uniref:Major facilitator superfamily (MFS) profile domain-containing protein n=1 Tax=Cronartium quercuum f. sp. fusiforme G11 TaxID=708437 RepID=A0A9P6N5U7_9BASI|nr:hypothetical protein CROQUDRAFT_55050 [Cronartium quercuum f. sp. fusiforme G11]
MALVMVLRSPSVMCYVCSIMLVKMLSPSSSAFGTINGMMQTCRAMAQAIGPIIGSSLFAISISSEILGGNLVWIILALISTVAQVCSFRISPDISRPKESSIVIGSDQSSDDEHA